VGEEATVRIKVSNPSSDVAVFEVYPDDFAAAIKAIPSSFTLESGSEKYVTLAVKTAQEGRLSTLLSVVGRPLASNAFQAGSGVKVPLAITVASATGLASVFATLGTNSWLSAIALVLLASWLVYRYWSRRQRSAAPLA
jgi:Flp pilus assembly protein TadB